jgi:hypothetical protein
MAADQDPAPNSSRDKHVYRRRIEETFPNPLTVVFLVWGVMFALAGLCFAFIH